MARSARIDRGGTLRPPRETPQGFLRADAWITRVGVLQYRDPSYPDGWRRELRLPEEVFSREHLASFADAPVIDDHLPPKPNGAPQLVTAANARDVTVGHVAGAARADGEHVAGELVFSDARTIKKLREGKRELSPGYECEEDRTPGVHPVYGRYDLIQRDIRVNHVALVDVARAGSSASVRMDAGEGVPCLHANPVHNEVKMDPEKLKQERDAAIDKLVSVTQRADAAEAEAKAQRERADAATARAEASTGRADAAEADAKALREQRTDAVAIAAKDAEIEKLTARADAAETKLDGFDKLVAERVAERVKLEREAMPVLGVSYKFDGVDDLEIMTAVVQKVAGFTMPKDSTLAYARARFDGEIARHKVCGDALRAIGGEVDARIDAAEAQQRTNMTLEQERQQMIRRNRGEK